MLSLSCDLSMSAVSIRTQEATASVTPFPRLRIFETRTEKKFRSFYAPPPGEQCPVPAQPGGTVADK